MDYTAALAALPLAVALLQLLLSGWRDLGPATIVSAGMVAILLPVPQILLVLVASALLATLAWARSSRKGVGQLPLDGLALAVALAPPLAVSPLQEHVPDARVVLASAQGAMGAALLALALRRPSALRVQTRWVGSIPVQGPPPRKEAPKEEPQKGEPRDEPPGRAPAPVTGESAAEPSR